MQGMAQKQMRGKREAGEGLSGAKRGGRLLRPSLSIIIVNWNGKELNGNCLRSIQAQDARCVDADRGAAPGFRDAKGVKRAGRASASGRARVTYEVIFVDNASVDGSADAVAREFPWVRVIRNATNRGYAGGNNDGIRAARGDFVLLLNNDTVLHKGFLKAMLAPMRDAAVGMVAAKTLLMDGSIDTLGHKVYGCGLAWDVRREEEADLVLSPCGVAVLYRKTVLDTLPGGLLDEDFHLYSEDLDLGLRIRLAGYTMAYASDAVLDHIHGASSKKVRNRAIFYGRRNELWVVVKDWPAPVIWRHLHQILLVQLGEIIRYTKMFKLHVLLAAKVSSLWGLPRMLLKRRAVQGQRRISAAQFEKLLVKAMLP